MPINKKKHRRLAAIGNVFHKNAHSNKGISHARNVNLNSSLELNLMDIRVSDMIYDQLINIGIDCEGRLCGGGRTIRVSGS